MNIPANYRELKGSERRPARGAHRVGLADPTETLSVTIRVRRNPKAPTLPDMKKWAETPPSARKLLSREDFSRKDPETYGAAPEDIKLVTDFAHAHGLTVVQTSIAKRTVVVSGTVKQMNHAFAVELGRYASSTESYRGREGSVHLPNSVADVVEGVFGLDNRRMAQIVRRAGEHSRRKRRPPILEDIKSQTPPQVAELYDFPPLKAAGQTIGLLEFGGGYEISDIQQFFNGLGLSSIPTLTAIGVDGAMNAPGIDSDADGEVTLDIDVAGSVAQNANIAVYFAPITEQGWVDIVTTAVHDNENAPSILSCSWGWPELETSVQGQPWPFAWTKQAMDIVSSTFQEAALLGITVLVASGDDGSNCDENDGRAHVLYPASDPWVTACGGTIIENVSGSSFSQGTWNDSSGATGGGVSDYFPLPSWQQNANVPRSVNDDHQGRGIPDIAGNASPSSGYNITVDGQIDLTGGTSAVAPLYAGLVAVINANKGHPVGYLNPTLYNIGNTQGQTVFQDINDGVSNGIQGAPGYTSGPGWDACTGWGSINGNALLSLI